MAGFPFLTETVSSRAALLCFASFVVGAAVPSLYLIAFSSPTSPVSGPVVLSSEYAVTTAGHESSGMDEKVHCESVPVFFSKKNEEIAPFITSQGLK